MSQKLKELREKQARIVEEARERLNAVTANTDAARATELETAHDNAMAEYDRLQAVIEREERMIALEKQQETRQEEHRRGQRPIRDTHEHRGVDDPQGGSLEYRNVFAKVVCGVLPTDLRPEERALLQRHAASFEERTQNGAAAAAGGYTVPKELADQIVIAMKAFGPMYDDNLCTVFNTSGGGEMTVPSIDDTANEAVAHPEGDAFADDNSGDVAFGQRVLNAFSFNTPFVKWSFELDSDSILNMEMILGQMIGERLGRIGNRQLTVGTGVNAPNGVATAASLGVTTAGQTLFTWDNVIDLEHSVDPAYRQSPRCRYMMHDETLKAARKLKDGDGNYLWQKGDVAGGKPALFNGMPYIINQHMDQIAANKRFMLFGDFSKYFVRKVGSPVIGVLRERFWPQVGIAGLIRFDGEIGDVNAIKAMKTAA